MTELPSTDTRLLFIERKLQAVFKRLDRIEAEIKLRSEEEIGFDNQLWWIEDRLNDILQRINRREITQPELYVKLEYIVEKIKEFRKENNKNRGDEW